LHTAFIALAVANIVTFFFRSFLPVKIRLWIFMQNKNLILQNIQFLFADSDILYTFALLHLVD
ncbi:hypothetical protein, partial [Prevotella sp.]|uniref:hypothetical protein n=1 Tax=Prevotella sp. TaxID=59823 RepID=UPI00307EC1F1